MGVQHDKRTFELPLEPPCAAARARARVRRLFGPAPCIGDAHPSAATLAAVRAMRDLHFANGHTPAHDAAEHGPGFFTAAAREFLRRAEHARSPEKARHRRIGALAMLVAMLDREDFLAQAACTPDLIRGVGQQETQASSSRKAVGQQETEPTHEAV